MKIEKLQSLSDYVTFLEYNMVLKNSTNALWLDAKKFKQLTLSYRDFLKQPLNLSMFVPCKEADGKWVVLEEPKQLSDKDSEVYYSSTDEEMKEYQQAKERVLFEGFEWQKPNEEYSEGSLICTDKWVCYDSSLKYRCIESLIEYQPTLTPNAIKQLGL